MIHRSLLPPVELPNAPIHELILAALADGPERVVMIDAKTGETATNVTIRDRVLRTAAGLAAQGFGPGDTLGLIAANCLDYPVAVLAAAALGGRTALPNPLGTADDFTNQLGRARAKVVVTQPALLDKVTTAAIAIGRVPVYTMGESDGAPPFEALRQSGLPDTLPKVAPTELVALPFSSGTSGRPKAVMLSHRNLVANVLQFGVGMPIAEGTRIIGVLPFFHIYGLVLIMMASLWKNRPLVVMARFELEAFLDAIARHQVELAPVVPPIMVALAKHPAVDKYNLGSLRYMMTGAAPLGAEVEDAVAKRLNVVVVQGYGMTEVCGASHLNVLEPSQIRRGSVGRLCPNMELRIVDPSTGEAQGPGDRGELWVRGPNVMTGYLDDPSATSTAIDDQGWLKTGDIGYVDHDGYCFIVDRLKELIKYKGHQVAPADLEAVLLTHPLIADAAVIPSPDAEAGEVPKAFVVLKGALTPQEIVDHVASKVAPFERVRRVEIVDAIPKSPSGKILRRILVDRERAATSAEKPNA